MSSKINQAAKLVIIGEIVALNICLVGAFGLLFVGKQVPNELWVFIGGIVTSLPSLLARVGGDTETPPEVKAEIVNDPKDPIPVKETSTNVGGL